MANTQKDLLARIAELEAENTSLKSNRRALSARASDKGSVMLYGLRQRFPVTFYPEEWDIIFSDTVREKVNAAITPAVRKAAAATKASK